MEEILEMLSEQLVITTNFVGSTSGPTKQYWEGKRNGLLLAKSLILEALHAKAQD